MQQRVREQHLPALLVPLLLAAAPAAQELPGFSVSFVGHGAAANDGEAWSMGHAYEAAFHLEPGAVPHARLGDGGFTAMYGTTLRIDEPAEYRLRARAQGGRAHLFLEGDSGSHWLPDGGDASNDHRTDWLELPAGDLTLTVVYTAEADAQERSLFTSWERRGTGERDFREEPLNARWTRVDEEGSAFIRQDLRRFEGQAELLRKGCTSCHDAGESAGRREAPRLQGVGSRLGQDWMARWIADPNALRPGADMPDLFGAEESELEDARAIAHFLTGSLGDENARAVEGDTDAIDDGRQLFHTLGCIACHGALESPRAVLGGDFLPQERAEVEVARPFGDLAGKWAPGALRDFLRRPSATHPDGLMPDFDLSLREARDLALYLLNALDAERPETQSADAALAQRGREQYAARGCAQCHGAVDGAGDTAPSAKPMAELDRREGCLDRSLPAGLPDYGFDNAERGLMRLGIESAQAQDSPAAPLDDARMRMEYLGCVRCHEHNAGGGLDEALRLYFVTEGEEVELGDEGRLPPDLTGVGHKLATAWIDEVLGEGAKARPYMAARMPRFGDHNVEGLGAGLARLSGVEPYSDEDAPPVTGDQVSAGRQLAGLRGLSCISCHTYGADQHAGTPGVELTAMQGRLRYAWYRNYMHAPSRYKPGTRMPAFGNGLRRMFEGDTERQVDALWAWMGLGEDAPAPDGIQSDNELELAVGDRPRVMRTFLSDAGSRAIAVGFPEGVHFGFDAESCRLVAVWRGAFLNAGGAWSGRGGNVTGGRGGNLWEALDGGWLALGARPSDASALAAPRFRGYRLDEAGVPTLMYALDGAQVEERWSPYPGDDQLFRRELVLRDRGGRDLWVRARPGVALSGEGIAVQHEDGQEWRRVSSSNDEVRIQIDYEAGQ